LFTVQIIYSKQPMLKVEFLLVVYSSRYLIP